METDVYEKINKIVSNQLRAETDTVDGDADIFEDLGADSLDVVEILMAVEESFGITIPEEDVADIRTVREFADYIESRIEE